MYGSEKKNYKLGSDEKNDPAEDTGTLLQEEMKISGQDSFILS